MARKPSRSEWRQVNGLWTCTIGNRGTRIRLFERSKGGVYHRSVWLPGHGEDRKSLHTADQHEALRLGRELLASLLRQETVLESGVLVLGDLWERYKMGCAAFIELQPRRRREVEAHALVLMAYFGAERDVTSFNERLQRGFVKKRRAGGIVLSAERITRPVRTRSVEVELQLLHAMFNWATTERLNSRRLLEENPLANVKRPTELNPKRPMATWERFSATRAAIQQLIDQASVKVASAGTPAGKARYERTVRKWTMLELALVIAESTGRRLSSIRQLFWEDINFNGCRILWRGDTDKKGIERTIPIPTELRDELKRFRLKLGAVSGLVFRSLTDPSKAVTRDSFDHWLRKAEARAGLDSLDGSLWHAYRRTWATARKDHPIADVAAAGGWKDLDTLIRCYQQPDEATLLRVMSEPRKVTERVQNA